MIDKESERADHKKIIGRWVAVVKPNNTPPVIPQIKIK